MKGFPTCQTNEKRALLQTRNTVPTVHSACTSDPIWIFGWSSGGNYAVAYAIAHPNRVRGLALMEPALLAVFPAGSRPPAVSAQIETVVPLFRAGRIHEGIAQFIGTMDPELSSEALDEFAADALSSDHRMYWEAHAMECPLVVSWAPTSSEWARLTQPALVIAGDLSGEWIQELAAKVAELLPCSELATLNGLDHGAPLSAPDIVARRVVEFVDRVAVSEAEDSPTM
jgi:pimeloyl-ACP methyl ester carboxylesterase